MFREAFDDMFAAEDSGEQAEDEQQGQQT